MCVKIYQKILLVVFLFVTSSRCGTGLDLGLVEEASSGLTCGDIAGGPYYINTKANVNAGPDRLARLGSSSLLIARTNYSVIDLLGLSTSGSGVFAGTGSAGFSGDGSAATAAQINGANGVAQVGSKVFIGDTANHRIRVVQNGDIGPVTGDGTPSHITNATGGAARFSSPRGLIAGPNGNYLYVADTGNHCIRRVRLSDYYVTDFAGTCTSSGFADGFLGAALFNGPYDIARDDHYLYVVDRTNHSIRRVRLSDGYTSTCAGTGGSGYIDGASTGAMFAFPSGLDVDRCGYVYVADSNNHAIRRVRDGIVETIAGVGAGGYTGDGGLATNANIDDPRDVEVIEDRVYYSGHTYDVIRVLELDE